MSASAIVTSSRTYSEDQATRTRNGLQPKQRIKTEYAEQAVDWHAYTHTYTHAINYKI